MAGAVLPHGAERELSGAELRGAVEPHMVPGHPGIRSHRAKIGPQLAPPDEALHVGRLQIRGVGREEIDRGGAILGLPGAREFLEQQPELRSTH